MDYEWMCEQCDWAGVLPERPDCCPGCGAHRSYLFTYDEDEPEFEDE